MSRFNIRIESLILFIGLVGITSIFGFYGYNYFHTQNPAKKNAVSIDTSFVNDDTYITYTALMEKIKQQGKSKIILIDVRSTDLFISSHVPQSTNVPIDTMSNISLQNGFTYIIITSSGNEQGFGVTAAGIIHDKDSKAPIFILRGGFESWESSSGQIISIGSPASIVDQAKVKYVTPEVLKQRLDVKQSYFILDMRPHDIYEAGHVINAINLPLDQIEGYYDKIPAGSRIVAYGNSELENFQVGVRLFDLGFFSTEVLKGGYIQWKIKGFDVK